MNLVTFEMNQGQFVSLLRSFNLLIGYQANLKRGKRICHCCPLAGLAINPLQPAIQNRPLSSRKHIPFLTRLLRNLHLLVEVRKDEQRHSLEDLL